MARPAKLKIISGYWISINDYPSAALSEKRQGKVGYSVQIDPSGRVVSCKVTETSGHGDLDATTCALVRKRAVFDPALNDQGNPIPSEWRNSVTWRLPSE